METSHAGPSSSQPARVHCNISVGKCYAQSATDRFGRAAKNAIIDRERVILGQPPLGAEMPVVWPTQESDDEETTRRSIFKTVPAMQAYRNNLTALSQDHNLYFVAYQGSIFVYRPRSVPSQTLPSSPDLQLAPRQTRVGRRVGGTIDTRHPHVINHVITGHMGNQEVVLACFDDGDVAAYYTKSIAYWVSQTLDHPRSNLGKSRALVKPKPFVHENVGISAWGLAIHTESRLIAVSSNRCEVTVFAPALGTDDVGPQEAHQNCECTKCCTTAEAKVRKRLRNWRIIVALGAEADNVPNISFIDDEHGNAEHVCAIDIKGNLWIGDIWKTQKPVIKIPGYSGSLPSEEFFQETARGWGILALPDTHFMTVQTVEELIGVDPSDSEMILPSSECPQPMADNQRYLLGIEGNPCPPGWRMPRAVRLSQQDNSLGHNPNPVVLDEDTQAWLLANNIPWTIQGPPGEAQVLDDNAGGADPDEAVTAHEPNEDGDEEEVDMDEAESDGDDEEPGNENDEDDDHDDSDHHGSDHDDSDHDDSDHHDDNDFGGGGGGGGAGVLLGHDVFASYGAVGPFFGGGGAIEIFFDESMALSEFGPLSPSLLNDPFAELGSSVDFWGPGPEVPATTASEGPLSGYWGPNILKWHRTSRWPPLPQRSIPEMPAVQQDMIFYPHTGATATMPQAPEAQMPVLTLPRKPNGKTVTIEKLTDPFLKNYHLLRAYEKDLELRSLGVEMGAKPREIGTLCLDAINFTHFNERRHRQHFRATSRLSMIVHVPELFLVVAGSATGRVLLLTPTKLVSRLTHTVGVWSHGFKPETVLPREDDEKEHRKMLRPLHGVAIGPVQRTERINETGHKELLPKRYRLMLHYRTHDILSYEIEREASGKLCIF